MSGINARQLTRKSLLREGLARWRSWILPANKATTGAVNITVVDGGGATNDLYRLASGTWAALGFEVGDVLTITGFANGTNNTSRVVSAISGADLSVPSTTLVAEGPVSATVSATSATRYLVTTALDSGLWVEGYELTINKWLVAAHGPSVSIADPASGAFLITFEISGIDIFGDSIRYTFTNANAAGTTVVHQCLRAFSYIKSIKVLKITDTLAHAPSLVVLTSGTISIGHVQTAGGGNYIRYALPVKLKKADNLKLVCVQNLATGAGKRMTYDSTLNVPATEAALATDKYLVDVTHSTYYMNYTLDANGVSRSTLVFDGRCGEL